MKTTPLPLSDNIDRLYYNLTSLGEIGRIFASETDFQKASENALRSILGAVAITSGALLTYNAQTQLLTSAVDRGLNEPPPNIPINGRLKRLLIQASKPLALHDLSCWPKSLLAAKKSIQALAPHIWVPMDMQRE